MADGTQLDLGSGGLIVDDEGIGGKQIQRIKFVQGIFGTDDGDTHSSNPMPVTDSTAVLRLTTLSTYGLAVSTTTASTNALVSTLTRYALSTNTMLANSMAGTTTFAVRPIAGTAQVVIGTSTYAEGTTEGVVIAAIRRDADTTPVDTTNEFAPLVMNSTGHLKVITSPSERAVSTFHSSTNSLLSTVALRVLAVSSNTASTNALVSTVARYALSTNTLLARYDVPVLASTWFFAMPAGHYHSTATVSTARNSTASMRQYVTGAQIINAHATLGTEVIIQDDGATVSTVMWKGYAHFTGGGATMKFDPPLRTQSAGKVVINNSTTACSTAFNLQGYQSSL